jgi:hypothetical protein
MTVLIVYLRTKPFFCTEEFSATAVPMLQGYTPHTPNLQQQLVADLFFCKLKL